jgi:hypothetical protein
MSIVIIVQENLRMSKIKMRCITCGKWFQSANAKEVTCPECTQKARKEKLATKNAPPITNKPAGIPARSTTNPPQPAAPKSKQTQSGTNQWLDKLEDVKIAQPDQPPVRPKIPSPPVQRDTRSGPGDFRSRPNDTGSAPPREERDRDRGTGPTRGPSTYRGGSGAPIRPHPPGQRPRQPMESGPGRGPYNKPAFPGKPRGGPPRGKPKTPRPPVPPRPKREKIPPPPPFAPTPEQVQQVEERYLELAQPAEFDGIRTQIAKEFSIPKKAVKKIVKELRGRQNIPSWWELQTYKGSTEEFEKIKAAYEPYLPVPHINVHKKIAEELSLKPGTVYQAIKMIRQELGLPQYNDPALHAEELAQLTKGHQAPDTEQSTALAEATSTSQEN